MTAATYACNLFNNYMPLDNKTGDAQRYAVQMLRRKGPCLRDAVRQGCHLLVCR